MKKFLIALLIIIILSVAVFFLFLRSESGYRSIYFVPEDATMIIETQDPVSAWDEIIGSRAWKHVGTHPMLAELNHEMLSYDSLIRSSKFFFNLIGKKALTVSVHDLPGGKQEYLYIIDAGKAANIGNLESLIKPIMGKTYEFTSREHKGVRILEIFDRDELDNYFVAFAHGNVIFSYDPALVEKSIEATENMVIGKNTQFLKVQSRIRDEGLFAVYVHSDRMDTFLKGFSAESLKSVKKATNYMTYTGFSFDVEQDGTIELEGYIALADSTPADYLSVISDGRNEIYAKDIVPMRLASLVKLNIDDASAYYEKAMAGGLDDDGAYAENITKLEKKLKISLQDNLLSWMDKEVLLMQTKPSNLGRSNEFAAVLHATDSQKAAENLQFLWKQIKKNTPVKIRSIDYKGYGIDYVAFPGLIKAFFGKVLDRLEKPYFTQIGKNVIISNHPQTLKNIIDDYKANNTLGRSDEYEEFIDRFLDRTGAFLYYEPPVLFHNLKGTFDAMTWYKVKQNKEYITCFSQGGMQISKVDDMLHFKSFIQYRPEEANFAIEQYNPNQLLAQFTRTESPLVRVDVQQPKDTLPKILIRDLDSRLHEEYYENGNLKLEVELRDGLKHGNLKMYHENGELALKGKYDEDTPTGKWKYYDEDGELLKTERYE